MTTTTDPTDPTGPVDTAGLLDTAAVPVDETLRGAIEAVLFVVDTPVSVPTLAGLLDVPDQTAAEQLAALAREYETQVRGFTLRPAGEGWRLYTREAYADVVERYVTEGQRARLTQAALETLAVVAYRQPVTRSRISGIRGVNVDGVMRTLLSRGLVAEAGSDEQTGGGLYVTTELFLEKLGLAGLDELPDLAPLLPDVADVLAESDTP